MDIIIQNVCERDLDLLSRLFGPHCGEHSEEILQVPEEKTPAKPVQAAPEKKKRRPAGYWEIPFSSRKEPKKYWQALSLCRKYGGVPYPEAVKREADSAKPAPAQEPVEPAPAHTPDPEPAPVKTNGAFEKGQKVKQIREEPGKAKAFGVCTVVGMRAGFIKVRDQSGWPHIVAPDVLAPAGVPQ